MRVVALAEIGAYSTALFEANQDVQFAWKIMGDLAVQSSAPQAGLEQLYRLSENTSLPFEEWQTKQSATDKARILARITLQNAHCSIAQQANKVLQPRRIRTRSPKRIGEGSLSYTYATRSPKGERLVTKFPIERYTWQATPYERVRHAESRILGLLEAAGSITAQPPLTDLELPYAIHYETGCVTSTAIPGSSLPATPARKLDTITDQQLADLRDTLNKGITRGIIFDLSNGNFHIHPGGFGLFDLRARPGKSAPDITQTLTGMHSYIIGASEDAKGSQQQAMRKLASRIEVT